MVQVQVQAQGLSGKSGRDTGREGALTSSFAALFFAMGFDAAASVSAGAAGAAEAGSTLSPLPVAPTSDIPPHPKNEFLVDQHAFKFFEFWISSLSREH